MIIAIDGPAGSGKSTVARRVAEKLRLLYIDTGAMYRVLTLKALQDKVDLNDEKALAGEVSRLRIEFRDKDSKQFTYLDGKDVSKKIRTARLTKKIAAIARMPKVRTEMVKLQRRMARARGAVMEGRDIGTVVFPNARYKFYLDAHFEERIKRRYQDQVKIDKHVSAEEVREDVMERDAADRTRRIAPLRIAPDAVFIDTTDLSVEEVAKRIVAQISE